MDRLTRHELKSDKFVQEVGHTIEYVEEHRSQFYRYGGIALAVLLAGGGAYYFIKHRAEQRQSELAKAIRVYNAPVMPTSPNPDLLTFPTQEARGTAIKKAFGDLTSKYSGTNEAAIAKYMLGLYAADQNNLAEAERYLREAAQAGDADASSLAKLSLSDILASTGKTADAEKLLKELADKPTILVSKEQAQLNLASIYAKTGRVPEAIKLVEPLRSQSGAVGRSAVTLYAELAQNR